MALAAETEWLEQHVFAVCGGPQRSNPCPSQSSS
jgi:hypothetical protein